MPISYSLLDVFADAPFQGTQIPVVVLNEPLEEKTKTSIASEFKQTETVFVDPSNKANLFSVYNSKEQTVFGAHTILAASYTAHEMGFSEDKGSFSSFQLNDVAYTIDSFIDKTDDGIGTIQYKRTLSPTIDTYTPEISRIAKALNIDEKHISYSKYNPLLVCVDHPILIVPFTKPEHIVAAHLNVEKWGDLLSEIYASEILMFAPGSISGASDFHGRLIHPDLARDEFPPIGKVMPEFIAYLAENNATAEGTHTFTIDRGSLHTRKSVLHAEFDKHTGKETQCRIGGHVIKIGMGSLLFS